MRLKRRQRPGAVPTRLGLRVQQPLILFLPALLDLRPFGHHDGIRPLLRRPRAVVKRERRLRGGLAQPAQMAGQHPHAVLQQVRVERMRDVRLGHAGVVADRRAVFDLLRPGQTQAGFVDAPQRLRRDAFDQLVQNREVRDRAPVEPRELPIQRIGVDLLGQLAVRQGAQLHQQGAAQDLLDGGHGRTAPLGLCVRPQIGARPLQALRQRVEQLADGPQFRHQPVLRIHREQQALVLGVEQLILDASRFPHFFHPPRRNRLSHRCQHSTYPIRQNGKSQAKNQCTMLNLHHLALFATGTSY